VERGRELQRRGLCKEQRGQIWGSGGHDLDPKLPEVSHASRDEGLVDVDSAQYEIPDPGPCLENG